MNEAVIPNFVDFYDFFVVSSFRFQNCIEVILPAQEWMNSEARGNAASMNFPLSKQGTAAQIQGGYST
jgi:hypothetical protein